MTKIIENFHKYHMLYHVDPMRNIYQLEIFVWDTATEVQSCFPLSWEASWCQD